MVEEPALVLVIVPEIITVPVPFSDESHPYAVRLILAGKVKFSVYVPGRIKIVAGPAPAAVIAVAIVL